MTSHEWLLLSVFFVGMAAGTIAGVAGFIIGCETAWRRRFGN